MLEALKGWFDNTSVGEAAAGGFVEQRHRPRYRFTGADVFLFIPGGDDRYRLHLKDLSCSGVSGLTDAPLGIGESVIVQLEEMLMPAAAVIWARRASMGLELVNPIQPACLERLYRRHCAGASWSPAMRTSPDFAPGWPFFTRRGAAEADRRTPTRARS